MARFKLYQCDRCGREERVEGKKPREVIVTVTIFAQSVNVHSPGSLHLCRPCVTEVYAAIAKELTDPAKMQNTNLDNM